MKSLVILLLVLSSGWAFAAIVPADKSGCFLPDQQNPSIGCSFDGEQAKYLFLQMKTIPSTVTVMDGLSVKVVEKKGKNMNCSVGFKLNDDTNDLTKATWFECGYIFLPDGSLAPRPTVHELTKKTH